PAACGRDEEQGGERRQEEPPHLEIGLRSTGRVTCAGPSDTFAPCGIVGSRYSRFPGSCASELEASVSVSLEPLGITVASSISRIASLRLPLKPEVLMPPSLTTIVLPR